MRGQPHIFIENAFKEKQIYIGISQEGKTNLLCNHLSQTTLPFTLYDTFGAASRKFRPLNPKTQRIIDPTRVYPMYPSMTRTQRAEVKEQRRELFRATCNRVLTEGNQIFVVDEVQENCTKRTIDPDLEDVVTLGGNNNVGFMATSQSVRQVNNIILGNTRHFFIFRTFLKPDVDWLSVFVPKDYILMSKDLPQYCYIYYSLVGTPQIGMPVKKMEL